jgi:hypothetical protein
MLFQQAPRGRLPKAIPGRLSEPGRHIAGGVLLGGRDDLVSQFLLQPDGKLLGGHASLPTAGMSDDKTPVALGQ